MPLSDKPPILSDARSPSQDIVRISGYPGGASRSPAQKTFHRLVARIDAQRQQVAQWHDYLPRLRLQIAHELTPLELRLDLQWLSLLRLLDAAHGDADTSRRERAKLSSLIGELCRDRLGRNAEGTSNDARTELIFLHDKHNDITYEVLQRQEAELLKTMIADAIGHDEQLSIQIAHAKSAYEVFETVERYRAREADGMQATQQPQAPPGPQGPQQVHTAQAETSPAREAAREEARETARQAIRDAAREAGATRAVRAVYRKLASALHPDREPDAAERDRKTALMQRVNQAHDRKDLLALLSLQLEIEQIDARHLDSLGSAKLAHYIAVLKEQTAQLDRELDDLTGIFTREPSDGDRKTQHPPKKRHPTTDESQTQLQIHLAALRRESQQLTGDLRALRDRDYLRAWLKHQRVEHRTDIGEIFSQAVDRIARAHHSEQGRSERSGRRER